MSDSVRSHRWQPTRLPRPWDSPSKNTGVGCHFLLQCMKVESESEVAQLCLTPSDPMDCSLPGSSIHGIFQARVLEWGARYSTSCASVVNTGDMEGAYISKRGKGTSRNEEEVYTILAPSFCPVPLYHPVQGLYWKRVSPCFSVSVK